MRVTDLWIDRFGDWTSVDLRDLALGLNVVYFPDAATKTALVHFVPSVLYGFSESVRQRFISAADDHELVAGGTVTLEVPQGRYRVTRHDRRRLGGELIVKNSDDELCPAETLNRLLHQVDRATYRETYVFPVRDFDGLAHLRGSELYARFARYGALAEPPALADARAGLAHLRAQAWQGLPGGIDNHQAACRRLRQEIQSLVANQRREEADLLRQQPELESAIARLKEEESRLQAAIEALLRKITALENEPAPTPKPAQAATPQNELQRRLALLEARLERWNRLLKRIQSKRSRLRARITECAVDEALWRDSQHAVWFARQSESFHRLEQRATELHRLVSELVEQSESQGRVRTQHLVSLEPLAAALRGELHEISSELRQYESRAYQHDVLVANERKLKEVQARLARQIRKSTHRKHRLLCRCQAASLVRDGEPLPTLAAAPSIDATHVQRAAAARAEELSRLRKELEQLRQQLRETQSQRQSTQSRLDAVNQRLATLRADKTIADKRAELAAAEAAWADATARWQRAAAAGHILQASAAGYNQSRHPEILAAASEYLRTLTAGRLTQVRARLVEGGLEVESSGKRWLPLGSLDGLDRKSLLFCLRLAAVGQQVHQGIQLPLLWTTCWDSSTRPPASPPPDCWSRSPSGATRFCTSPAARKSPNCSKISRFPRGASVGAANGWDWPR